MTRYAFWGRRNQPLIAWFAAVVLMVVALCCGCHRNEPQTAPPVISPGPPQSAPVSGRQHAGKTPIKDSLDTLLARDAQAEHSIFPKGTRLLSVNLKAGVATLDFSRDFSALANSGETVESEAQKALRQTLSRFPNVQKMRVTVEGSPFDSQVTDWNTPFAVRGAGIEDASRPEVRP